MLEKALVLSRTLISEKLTFKITAQRIMTVAMVCLSIAIIVFAALWIVASNEANKSAEQVGELRMALSAHTETIEALETENTSYEANIVELTGQVQVVSAESAGLMTEREQLLAQVNALTQENGQLEAENGDLLKKFKTLSGPS
jgi:chromosome segregation ATPase